MKAFEKPQTSPMFVMGIEFTVKDPCVRQDHAFSITIEDLKRLMQEGKITCSMSVEQMEEKYIATQKRFSSSEQ